MRVRIISILLATLLAVPSFAQNPTRDFRPVGDSLRVRLKNRTTVDTKLKLESVMKRGNTLDFHFSQELGDYHWTQRDIDLLKQDIKSLMPEGYAVYSVGDLYSKNTPLENLITPSLGNGGDPSTYRYRYDDRRGKTAPLVTRLGEEIYEKGMTGRHIALWQSHGRYYDEGMDAWTWQRAPLFTTVEDMFTQSFVLPFLIPMLENAGAYVMTPRERDIQKYEIIADNDPSFHAERDGLLRRKGSYDERGHWEDAGTGFADPRKVYVDDENPFTMGTARKADCATEEKWQKCEAIWSFKVPEDGSYAVYVSYKSLPSSTDEAHYTVRHPGGDTEFLVNQRIGGGTWIYLGTFDFSRHHEAHVVLDNIVSSEEKAKGHVITADAVKIGGGMGKIARGSAGTPKDEWTVSGLPSYAEGALYWEQWAGVGTGVMRNWEGDYTQDFASRGAWVTMMGGGSAVNPKYEGGKGIPFDLSIGFHSDAGLTQNDSIIGTLSIYTLLADGSSKLPDGRSRELGRHLAGIVQDQVCDDVRSTFESQWSKRELWNRSYSEARTTSVPGMLLESLSHQNFADMRYGLDPAFRFTVSRAVYKGLLKFLSDEHGIPYTVQPLPVNSFSARFISEDEVRLSWKATEDPLEPTATPDHFILYTRVGDGAFDRGVPIVDLSRDGEVYSTVVGIDKGDIYSYRIVAVNGGGRSFPSETMSVGRSHKDRGSVLVVNNFDRVSPPAWFDTPQYAGFDRRLDSGVGYIQEINYIGDMYEFRRNEVFTDNSHPGFGGSFSDHAGETVPGNTFDFIRIHGKAIMEAGYSFDSASRDAFVSGGAGTSGLVDLLCGKQVTVRNGSGRTPDRYEVFPEGLQNALRNFTSKGGSLIVSGANIGTDVWGSVFPVEKDAGWLEASRGFIMEVLGYSWTTDHGCYNGQIFATNSKTLNLKSLRKPFEFHQALNSEIYCVENPDGIQPVDKNGSTILKYYDNNVPAAVAYDPGKYRVVSFGFPLEVVKDEEVLATLIEQSLSFLAKR